MAAVIIEIADAVVEVLNEAVLSLPFTAKRLYVPIHEIRDLKDLTVSVVPSSLNPRILDRAGRNMYDYFIDIGIQQLIGVGKLSDEEINSACDPLMQLAEEIISELFLIELPIAHDPPPRCIDADNMPIYDPHHIDERRVFTSLVTLNFRQGR